MFFLKPLSFLYGGAVRLRNYLYDKGFLDQRKLPVPVVSVGNVSAGGTGKTSTVRHLAHELGRHLKIAILLRGYRRKTKGVLIVSEWGDVKANVRNAGDEAFLLARLLPDACVIVCEDRFEGGRLAVDLGAQLILLDDGFQHRRLFRDIDLVLIRKGDLSDRLLPEGRLREPLSSLKRADALILSYQETEPFEFGFEGKPVFRMFRKFCCFLDTDFNRVPLDEFKGREVIAFAGLGSNRQFFRSLEALGFKVKRKISLPDHYDYEDFELDPKEIYVTTPKDIVKLPPSKNLFALDFRLKVEGLVKFVLERLNDRTSYLSGRAPLRS